MTKRLYLEDSHKKQHTARVLRCQPGKGDFLVTLNESCLFPTAGGQPTDHGRIGPAMVLDVEETESGLLHHVDQPLEEGSLQEVSLDWARRFDFMQQHTGEHLFSFVLFRDFKLNNVGFHLADTYATIDMDGVISREELDQAVLTTNALIAENLPVTAFTFPDETALHESGLPLRKEASGLTAPIRIVSIQGADACTCCAPHCKFTGEIGHLLVEDAVPYKGGMRITFLCGLRATRRAMEEHAALDTIARRFSTGRPDAVNAVVRQGDELSTAKYKNRLLTEELNRFLAKELLEGAAKAGKNNICLGRYENMEQNQLSALAAQTVKEPHTLAALFSVREGQTAYCICVSQDFPADAGELIQAVNAITGGKGGGRGTRAQGQSRSVLPPEGLEQMKTYFLQRLK